MKNYKLKKIFTICVAMAVLASAVLCGCGGTSDDGNDTSSVQGAAMDSDSNGSAASAVDMAEGQQDVSIQHGEQENVQEAFYTIGVSFPSDETSFYSALMAYCDENYPSERCEVICYGSENDQDKQNAGIEDMLSQGYDGIIIIPVTPDGAVSAVKKCNDSGVPVLTLDRQIVSDECTVTAHVGTDYELAGKTMAESITEGLGKKLPDKEIYNVVELAATEDASDSVLLRAGIAETLEENPKVNVLAVLNCDESGETAETVAMDCFEAYEKLDGFICHDDDLALACISAYKKAEEKPESLVISSFGGKIDACKAVQSGEMYSTVLQHPEMIGLAVESLCDNLSGKDIDILQHYPVETVNSENAGRMIEDGIAY